MIDMNLITAWFYQNDLFIDVFSSLVLLFILVYAIRYYRINKDEKYRYFIVSFGLLTLAFIAKILTHFTIYYRTTRTGGHLGAVTLTMIQSSDIFVFWGTLIYRILALLALYFLYLVYVERHSKTTIFLTLLLLLMVGYESHDSYYLFHFTLLLLFSMITWFIFKGYRKNKYVKTKLMGYSFLIITISHAVSMLLEVNPIFYIIAELIQLIGYLLLLFVFIRIIRNGKKKE
jgi:hypothetical protein